VLVAARIQELKKVYAIYFLSESRTHALGLVGFLKDLFLYVGVQDIST
jgi:hypothetical protein